MRICLTLNAARRLERVLAKEAEDNPNAVFRIWEFTSGRYNDASIHLGLALDEADENDESAECCGLPFTASADFLSLRGDPHIFCIFLDENGMPGVFEF